MSSSSNAQALQVALSHLAGALTYTEPTNIETNKKLWNEYASNYSQANEAAAAAPAASGAAPSEWVLEMASHVQRGAKQLEFLGDEWSDDASLTQSLNHFLFPYLGVDTLTPDEWAESRATEELIAQRTQAAHSVSATGAAFGPECSGGTIPLVNHLPPSSLQSWCAAQAASAPDSSSRLVVGELGVGGGRVAGRVYPHVRQLYCFDIAEKMMRQAQRSIAAKHSQRHMGAEDAAAAAAVCTSADAAVAPAVASSESSASSAPAADAAPAASSAVAAAATAAAVPANVSFHLLTGAPAFPPRLHGSLDLLYCFDVLPHVDLHTISAYFRSIRALLRPADDADADAGGPRRPPPRAFLHTANVCAPLGWDRFSRQSRCTAGGFYFLSPDIVRQLARQHGYRIVQESRWTVPAPAPASITAAADAAGAPAALPAAAASRASNLYYQRDFLFVLEVI